jgi:hypothetical protein
MSLTNLTSVAGLIALGWVSAPGIVAAASQQETIVFVRHGEKPPEGLGQINCRGLNRALALPQVLTRLYGKPDFIFAPDPHQRVRDNGRDYNYIRPLATIEPTAIRLGLPVRTEFGYRQIAGLQRELTGSRYKNALIFVAWEHWLLVKLVRNLVTSAGGDASAVPDWSGSDFDSIYVLRFTRDGNKAGVTFTHDSEGLDNRATTCP